MPRDTIKIGLLGMGTVGGGLLPYCAATAAQGKTDMIL